MDLEQRLRASLVAPDPGVRFTAAVMARVRRGRWSTRSRVLMSTVVAVGIAAAMLAWRLYGEPQTPVVVAAPAPQPLPAAAPAALVKAPSAEIPLVPPLAVEAKPPVEPLGNAPSAAPEQQTTPRYTVVALLRHEAAQPEGRAVAQAFFDLLME